MIAIFLKSIGWLLDCSEIKPCRISFASTMHHIEKITIRRFLRNMDLRRNFFAKWKTAKIPLSLTAGSIIAFSEPG
jgi:hypothetical protein